MFDIGFSELLVIGLIGLLVLGPKRLPEVARTLGSWVGQVRAWISNVKQDLDREINSAELSEFRKLKAELEETRRMIEQSANQTIAQVSADLEGTDAAAGTSTPSIAPPRKSASGQPAKPRKRAKARGGTKRTKKHGSRQRIR
jgi:sec-independent protein translocase protein TatB